jgi:hypothetical protein
MARPVVRYIDFGYTSAAEFWSEVVLSAYERFKEHHNRQNAIDVSVHAWQVHEWIWHENNPGEDTRGNADYTKFKENLLKSCPELAWIRDVADAGKHRGLGRSDVEVRRVATEKRVIGSYGTAAYGKVPYGAARTETTPLIIRLVKDSRPCGFAEALSRVMDYWRAGHFRKAG